MSVFNIKLSQYAIVNRINSHVVCYYGISHLKPLPTKFSYCSLQECGVSLIEMVDIMIPQALKIKISILEKLQVLAKAIKHLGCWFLR